MTECETFPLKLLLFVYFLSPSNPILYTVGRKQAYMLIYCFLHVYLTLSTCPPPLNPKRCAYSNEDAPHRSAPCWFNVPGVFFFINLALLGKGNQCYLLQHLMPKAEV